MFRKFKPSHKRILLDIFGWFFLVVGTIGIFLPILQGVVFLILGAYFLSLHSPWFHNKLHALKQRYPSVAKPLERADTWVRKQFGLEVETDQA